MKQRKINGRVPYHLVFQIQSNLQKVQAQHYLGSPTVREDRHQLIEQQASPSQVQKQLNKAANPFNQVPLRDVEGTDLQRQEAHQPAVAEISKVTTENGRGSSNHNLL